MNTTPASISELIGQWKTIGAFAVDIGCGYEAARQMRRRGSIAPEWWAAIVDKAAAKGIEGVTLEWLGAQRAKTNAEPAQ
ncbi:MAG: hypothetical protein KDJ90_00530 [Nitratireductor sp.]|nr:hypothetical protein [Nitratireductor sp.]